MYLNRATLKIEDNEVRYWMVPNSGCGGFPCNMGIGQARELAEEILLAIHAHEKRHREAEVLDRILDDVQAAPTLEERERETFEVLCGDEACDSNGKA